MNDVSVYPYPEEPEVARIRLCGDIGLGAIPRISALSEWFEKKGILHFAVDLADVRFLSSPAVGALMGLRSRVVGRSGSVSLFSANPELSEKLSLMGVHLAMPVFRDEKSFLDYFHWEFRGAFRNLSLLLPASASFVPPTRRLVVGLLRSKGFSEREAFILESIVDELANNAIEHGCPPDNVFRLELKFSKSKTILSVRNSLRELSEDERKALEEKYAHPKMTPGSLRGRGIVLVKRLSSQMTFRVEPREIFVEVTRLREET